MTKNDWIGICGRFLADHCTKHFSPLEISDVGRMRGNVVLSSPALELLKNAYKLINVLEWLREKGGVAPVLINSWYRSPEYNKAIGGVSHSMHMTCGAADVVKIGRTPAEVANILENHLDARHFGLGRYKSFTHIDVRGYLGRSSPARWGSNE